MIYVIQSSKLWKKIEEILTDGNMQEFY